MPGVPASVTTATSPPSPSTSSTSPIRASSVCSLHTASRGAVTPACCSSRPVRRVSSQHTSPAPASASTARGDRSPRLPIGVPTSTSRPGDAVASATAVVAGSVAGAVAELDDVADAQAPPLERPGLGLDHPCRLGDRPPDPVAGHAHGLDDRAGRRRRRRRRAGSASRSVCTQRHERDAPSPRPARRAGAAPAALGPGVGAPRPRRGRAHRSPTRPRAKHGTRIGAPRLAAARSLSAEDSLLGCSLRLARRSRRPPLDLTAMLAADGGRSGH